MTRRPGVARAEGATALQRRSGLRQQRGSPPQRNGARANHENSPYLPRPDRSSGWRRTFTEVDREDRRRLRYVPKVPGDSGYGAADVKNTMPLLASWVDVGQPITRIQTAQRDVWRWTARSDATCHMPPGCLVVRSLFEATATAPFSIAFREAMKYEHAVPASPRPRQPLRRRRGRQPMPLHHPSAIGGGTAICRARI